MISTPESLLRRYAEWNPATDDPPQTAAADVAALDAACRPADPRAIAVEIARTVDQWQAPADERRRKVLAENWSEALEGCPLDIAAEALKRVRLECTFLPMPAEIRARVEEAMGARKRALIKARVAATMAARRAPERPRVVPTDEDRAAVTALLDEALRGKRVSDPDATEGDRA